MDGLGSVGRSAPGSYGPEAGSIVEASDLALFFVVGWVFVWSSVGFRCCGAENSVVVDGNSLVFFNGGGYLNSGQKGHSKPFLYVFVFFLNRGYSKMM